MRVGLYPRVSGHEQEDNYSIPEQIDRMKKYCEARDWMVYKIYTDSVYSGSNMERPGLQDMIKDVEKGKLDMVLVYKLDRLSRSQKDTLYLIEDVFDYHYVVNDEYLELLIRKADGEEWELEIEKELNKDGIETLIFHAGMTTKGCMGCGYCGKEGRARNAEGRLCG